MSTAPTHVIAGFLALSGLLMGTSFGAEDPPPPPTSPKDVLTTNGLTQSGTFFIVESEGPVRQKIANMRPVMLDMETRFNQWAAILHNEDEFQYLTDYRVQLGGHLTDVDNEIARMPQNNPLQRQAVQQSRIYRQRIDQEMRDNLSQIEIRRKRLVGPAVKEKMENDFGKAREKFLQAAGETQPLYDKVKEEYAILSKNSTVKNALTAHGERSIVKFKLGPSDKLKKDVANVIKYEKAFSPETAVPTKKRPRPTFKGTKKR
jgi:hypothetical protein